MRGVVAVDRLVCHAYEDNAEFLLQLIGIRPKARPTSHASEAATRWVENQIKAADGLRHYVFLPRPQFSSAWLGNLIDGNLQVGMLFLRGAETSLNAAIAAAGICTTDPDCGYLSPQWNVPNASQA